MDEKIYTGDVSQWPDGLYEVTKLNPSYAQFFKISRPLLSIFFTHCLQWRQHPCVRGFTTQNYRKIA
jgi:hypothetical protein